MKRIVTLALSLVIALAPANHIVAQASTKLSNVTHSRIAGKNRYLTSVEASKASIKTGSDKVIISNGDTFADALSAGNLVNEWGAPILLVGRNYIANEVKQEIKRLNAKEIYLIGGEIAVSKAVENELKELGTVHRIYGKDRYETSKKVIELLPSKPIGVASGVSSTDALTAIPFLKGKGHLLLVNPRLDNSDINASYVFGGTAAIPGFKGVKRFAGANRYETALEIARASNKKGIILASGVDSPDALSASILAYTNNMSILLAEMNPIAANVHLKENSITNVIVIGGTQAVPDANINNILKGKKATPTLYEKNSITVGKSTIPWVYWKNVVGSTWWNPTVEPATGLQDAIDKEKDRWVDIMTKEDLFSIYGTKNLWVASHNYHTPGKQVYHIPQEIIVTDQYGISAKYKLIDRAKTYDFIGTGTYGKNDVFVQTCLPDGKDVMHYTLVEILK